MAQCLHCHLPTTNPRFCNNSCAAKHNNAQRTRTKWTFEQKEAFKINPLRRKPSPQKYARTTIWRNTCSGCGVEYWARTGRRATCSDLCCHEVRITNSHRLNRATYNGVRLDSSWELDLAKWLDAQAIEWERPSFVRWNDGTKDRRYFPDFYLPALDLYLDPKNPDAMNRQRDKMERVSNVIKIVYGDLDHIKQEILARTG